MHAPDHDSATPTDSHYVKMEGDTAVAKEDGSPTQQSSPPPTRPRPLVRAASARAASTSTTSPLQVTGSVRAFVRLATMQEETLPPITATATTTTRETRSSSVTNRSTARTQSVRLGLGAPTSVAPLVRALSSMLRLNGTREEAVQEETFRCHICFDDVGVSEATTLASCGHKYCSSCFKPYLELKITEGNVYPVCFHPPYLEITQSDGTTPATSACGVAVSPDQIQQIVDPSVYTKYEFFKFNKEHQHARECPFCSLSQDCTGPEDPHCVCVQCSKSFCFFHGNAHADGTCADYELQHAQEESLNRAKIDEISKPCPGCQRDVEKNGGCNHMKCVGCNTSFCWLCGEVIDDTPTPSHYADGVGSCSGKQFDGMEQTPTTWKQLFFIVLLTLLAVPPAFVLAVVLAPLVWLCNRSESLWEVFIYTLAVITIALCVFVGLVLVPVGWAIDICVAVIVFIVVLTYELLKLCVVGCCIGSRRCENDAAANSSAPPASSDLETGLVVAVDPTKSGDGAGGEAATHAGAA